MKQFVVVIFFNFYRKKECKLIVFQQARQFKENEITIYKYGISKLIYIGYMVEITFNCFGVLFEANYNNYIQ